MRSAVERIGNVYYSRGNISEAEKYYEQGLAFDREINDPFALGSDYGNLANALDGLGDLKGALKMQQQSLAEFMKVGERRGISTTENNLGNLLVEMGNLEEAKKYFERALAMTREISYRRGEPYPIAGIGDRPYPKEIWGVRAKSSMRRSPCARNSTTKTLWRNSRFP